MSKGESVPVHVGKQEQSAIGTPAAVQVVVTVPAEFVEVDCLPFTELQEIFM